jgi:hypothetical protein
MKTHVTNTSTRGARLGLGALAAVLAAFGLMSAAATSVGGGQTITVGGLRAETVGTIHRDGGATEPPTGTTITYTGLEFAGAAYSPVILQQGRPHLDSAAGLCRASCRLIIAQPPTPGATQGAFKNVEGLDSETRDVS